MNATISGTSKKMVYKVEKGTQYEEQKKDVGRKRQSTDELLSKRDDCTSRTVLNRVKEQEKAIALLSKEIHLGGKSAFLHCLAMSFSAKNSTKNVTSVLGMDRYAAMISSTLQSARRQRQHQRYLSRSRTKLSEIVHQRPLNCLTGMCKNYKTKEMR